MFTILERTAYSIETTQLPTKPLGYGATMTIKGRLQVTLSPLGLASKWLLMPKNNYNSFGGFDLPSSMLAVPMRLQKAHPS